MTVVVLTSGTTYAIPGDWTAANQLEAWGAGAGGGAFNISSVYGGGGGGAYSSVSNIAGLSGTVTIQIGAGGAGETASVSPTSGTATWFNGTTIGNATVSANPGLVSASAGTGGLGGSTTGTVGTTKSPGGPGGLGNSSQSGAAGGGAASAGGTGGTGGAATSTNGGTGGSSPSAGAGGAGGLVGTNAVVGASNALGGGGGGGGYNSSAFGNGAAGGAPGGGGGGGAGNTGTNTAGAGARGQITVTYTPGATTTTVYTEFPDTAGRGYRRPPNVGCFAYPWGSADVVEVVNADKWLPHYPDFARAPRRAFYQGCYAYGYVFVVPEVVTVDKWFNQQQYVPRLARGAHQDGWFTYPFAVSVAETVNVDKWQSQQQYVPRLRRPSYAGFSAVPLGVQQKPMGFGSYIYPTRRPRQTAVGAYNVQPYAQPNTIRVRQGADTVAITGTTTAPSSNANYRGKGYNLVPEVQGNEVEHRRRLAIGVNLALSGRMNVCANLTLTPNASSTTITDVRINSTNFIHFMPQTANAGAELGAGTLYVPALTQLTGSAVVQHANNAQTDRTYTIAILG